jgi:hypothetical protein
MAKQRLTSKDIELIKHWGRQGQKHWVIASAFNCSRENITKILRGYRWSEVPVPNYARGEELSFRFLQHGTTEYNG